MDHFTIKDIELLTGIKAHTLRVWEQRYSLLAPAREGREHRTYDADDLKHALRVAQLYHSGVKVSALAAMSETEIDQRLEDFADEERVSVPVRQLIEATVSFDEPLFRQVLGQIRSTFGVEQGMLRVIYPFLKRIGQMWMHGKVKPGQEHFASTLIRDFLIHMVATLNKPINVTMDRRMMFFAPEGDWHEIPLLFAYYLFRKHGWWTIYLGADMPISIVSSLAEEHQVGHVFLHPLVNLTQVEMDTYLHRLAAELPAQRIIVSGPLTKGMHPVDSRIKVLRSEQELLTLADHQG